jgi:phage-related minor tail protein
LSGLHDEAKFKHTLVRLSAEQVTEAERRRQIIMKIQSEGKVVEEARVEAILKTEAATRKAIAAEEQRQSTMDMVTDNIENAFMAIVDGSKSVEDAFKSMLRNIILEIYQQQVAQPAATAITGFLKDLLFQADGGAWQGGSQIQAYANGGVIGGPTTFPMSGGKTGLMGEAGPEAIMPLKRGSNGKLGVQMEGGGGDVININQSFNFQANGDDSVKKLIAQAAPKIADMAKASVIDSRRRGGSTKAAFG